MFTGIVEEVGEVVGLVGRADGGILTVAVNTVAADVTHGASIAVDGVCLTVIGWDAPVVDPLDGLLGARTELRFDVMGETLTRSTVGRLQTGQSVNLERAVRADGRLGGHVVQGHVDGTGEVLSRVPGSNWDLVRIGMPVDLARYVAEKGSVSVDGVSLTVSAVGVSGGSDWFEVGLIPETLRATTLGRRAIGHPVNLEVDVLAKYAERLLTAAR